MEESVSLVLYRPSFLDTLKQTIDNLMHNLCIIPSEYDVMIYQKNEDTIQQSRIKLGFAV